MFEGCPRIILAYYLEQKDSGKYTLQAKQRNMNHLEKNFISSCQTTGPRTQTHHVLLIAMMNEETLVKVRNLVRGVLIMLYTIIPHTLSYNIHFHEYRSIV